MPSFSLKIDFCVGQLSPPEKTDHQNLKGSGDKQPGKDHEPFVLEVTPAQQGPYWLWVDIKNQWL
jgi:hypothetical protein